jgi:regulation of enolase protein 1 (concanavalin A-like superfamily)
VTTRTWTEGTWLNRPRHAVTNEGALRVHCAEGSDFWRTTYYGFVRDTGHALLYDLAPGQACEVSFHAALEQLYDQAGLLVRAGPESWLKAGVEVSDGFPQLGAVATHPLSDWSCAPVPEWAGTLVTVRASWTGEALLVRARSEAAGWRTVRLAPFAATGTSAATVQAGLYCAAPQRAGLSVTFTAVSVGPADTELHLPDSPDRSR